ncbi:hypothetical protein HK097_007630 [Rhizophlyctis rosea]|uniref:Uncharacterized protein n=1 Tax=Rhizophlyctis rosea TaxID=64517 RepID=A0AAD5SJD5_9FUNG|nr:hypothetical protein HK097_007630 [Rhizophlyctis rosea]
MMRQQEDAIQPLLAEPLDAKEDWKTLEAAENLPCEDLATYLVHAAKRVKRLADNEITDDTEEKNLRKILTELKRKHQKKKKTKDPHRIIRDVLLRINYIYIPTNESDLGDGNVLSFKDILTRSEEQFSQRDLWRFHTWIALLRMGIYWSTDGKRSGEALRQQYTTLKIPGAANKYKNMVQRIKVAWNLRVAFGWGVACWVQLGGGDGRGLQDLTNKQIDKLVANHKLVDQLTHQPTRNKEDEDEDEDFDDEESIPDAEMLKYWKGHDELIYSKIEDSHLKLLDMPSEQLKAAMDTPKKCDLRDRKKASKDKRASV